MGILDLVATNATDYARLGAWLVNNHEAREALRARIRAAAPVLFNDPAVVPAWEAVLLDAVRRRAAALAAIPSPLVESQEPGQPQEGVQAPAVVGQADAQGNTAALNVSPAGTVLHV
jgi:hypothetical protein